MADRKVWKIKNPNGAYDYVDQELGYDKQMFDAGYEEADDAEAAAYAASPNSRSDYEAPPITPEEVEGRAEMDADLMNLATQITQYATGMGETITQEEALSRARNVRDIMGERPKYEPVEGEEAFQFDKPYDEPLAIIDGVLGGLALGLPKLAVRKIADAIDLATNAETPSALSTKEMGRRQRAYPQLTFGVELGTGFAQAGVGALKTLAPRAFASLGTTGKLLAATDIGGKVAGAAGKGVSRVLGRGGAGAVSQATSELQSLGARGAAGAALTEAEKQVLDVATAVAKPTLLDTTSAAVSRGVAKVIPPLAGKTLPAIGKVAAGKTAAAAGVERAISQRAEFLMERQLAADYAKFGLNKKTANLLARSVAGGAAAGAVGGAVSELNKTALEKSQVITPTDLDAISESTAATMWRGATKGGTFGGVLGGTFPLASKGFAATLEGVRGASKKLAEIVIPKVGTILTDIDPETLRKGVVMADLAAEIPFSKNSKELGKAIEFQVNNVDDYLNHVAALGEEEMLNAGLLAAGDSSLTEQEGRAVDTIGTLVSRIRNKFMKETPEGWKIDQPKLRQALLRSRIVGRQMGGQTFYEVVLPDELGALQNKIGLLENYLTRVEGELNDAVGSSDIPTDALQSAATRFLLEREGGELLRAPVIMPYGRVETSPLGQTLPMGSTLATQLTRGTTGPLSLPREAALYAGPAVALREATAGAVAPIELGSEVGIGFGTGFLAQQAFELGAGAAGAAGFTISQAANLLLDPKNAVRNFALGQKLLVATKDGTNALGRFLTLKGAGQQAARQAIRELPTMDDYFYSGPERDEPELTFSIKGARQLYEMDKLLLGRLNGPDAVGSLEGTFGKAYEDLDKTYPELSSRTTGVIPKQVAFLNSKLPNVPEGQKPSDRQVYDYGLYSRYVRDPDAIYKDIVEKTYVPSQAIEVLQKVYPARYAQLQSQLLEAVGEAKANNEKIDSKQIKIIDTLLGRNTAGLSAAQIKSLQESVFIPPKAGGGGFSSKRPELERQGTTLAK